MKFIIVIALMMFAGPALAGGWHTETIFDKESAEKISSATISDDDGYRIDIFRNKDHHVRWKLSMPESSFDRLVTAGPFILFRIDDGASLDMEISEINSPDGDTSNGSYGRAVLWHGQGESPTRGTLRTMLDGKTLYVRFVTGAGSHVDRTFTLTGAPDVISSVLGINAVVDPVRQAFEQDRDAAILGASAGCMANKSDFNGCLRVLSECMKDTSTLTGQVLHQCMQTAGFPFE